MIWKYVIVVSFFSSFLWTSTTLGQPREEYGQPFGKYKGPLGIEVISFSPNWKEPHQLETVYKELLNNFYSEEIQYFSTVYIYPDSPEGVAAYYYPDFDYGDQGQYIYKKDRYIEIFNGKDYQDVSQFARILSHEYGHHFTYYYLLTKENRHFAEWKDTQYAQIRNFKSYPKVKYYYAHEDDLHYERIWDICEIAAEDYVQLFGSPLAKSSTLYYDAVQRVERNIQEVYYDNHHFNLMPQENLHLPLATEVPGLYLYWLELAGYTSTPPKLPMKPQITLRDYYPVYEDYYQYHIQWSPASHDPQMKYEYTLVAYPTGEPSLPEGVKTVSSGQPLEAFAGSAVYNGGRGTMNVLLDNYEGSYTFQLFIKDQRGYVFSSDPLHVHFDHNKYKTEFKDFSANHWSYPYAEFLLQAGLIKGYPDGTFQPERFMSRSEFISLVIRSFYYPEVGEPSSHWFIRDGYFQAAKNLGLIRSSDYGVNFINFRMDDPITREEIAFISARCMELTFGMDDFCPNSKVFKDQHRFRYKKEIDVMASCYIIQGYPDGTFGPHKYATRAEAIKVLYGLLRII